jgi:hypothetical protein
MDTDYLISTGPQTAMTIQSGSEQYTFRRFHQVLTDLRYFSNPVRAMMISSPEPVRFYLHRLHRESFNSSRTMLV